MMNTENDYFRDYCTAENSEDEESNFDLQSRLYAEIYYTPYQLNEVEINSSFTAEQSCNKDKRILKNNVDESQPITTKNSRNLDPCRNCTQYESYISGTTDRIQVEPTSEVFTISQHRIISTDTELRNKNLCPDNNEIEIDLDPKNNLDKRLLPRAESTLQTTKITEICDDPNLSVEKTVDTDCVLHISSTESNSDKDVITSVKSISNEIVNEQIHDKNILKKYEFSKGFINNLFIEKYKELITKLREEEIEIVNESIHAVLPDSTQMGTKYLVQDKSEKEKQNRSFHCDNSENMFEDISDSEESILEVPVPPKPQPPIINLQDSDDDLESISSNCSTICLEYINISKDRDKQSTSLNTQKDTSNTVINITDKRDARSKKHINKELANQNPSTLATQYTTDVEVQEEECLNDIVLNCTDLQKGASSIREIQEMSKKVQSQQNCSHIQEKENNVNKAIPSATQDVCKRSVKKSKNHLQNYALSNEPYIEENDNDNFYVCTEPTTSYIVENNDHPQSTENCTDIDFTKDISLSSVSFDNETPSESRKRRYDGEREKSVSSAQTESNNEANTVQHYSHTQKNQRNTINTYIIDNTYNQLDTGDKIYAEDFDVENLQSKMSRDPRLWAILDEDLMPSPPKRLRFWNVKCSHCQREGHQRYNCPEPRRLPRCHMCGTQGHTETRCPRKMCLTCGKKQGTFRKTCETCKTLFCTMCNAVGHKATDCPDLWRRFHQTTKSCTVNIPENIMEVMKPANLLYCCNCTKQGHDASTCKDYRWSPHFPTPAHVSSYTDGPSYINNSAPNPAKQSVEALTKNKKRKGNQTYTPTVDGAEVSYVICSYGRFKITENGGQEIKRDILSLQDIHIDSLLAGRAAPHFLNELLQTFSFEVKIYRENNVKLVLLIRAEKVFIKPLLNLITHWLQLEEDEKEQRVRVDLPHNRTKFLNLITYRLCFYSSNSQDPRTLYNSIKQLKNQVSHLKGNSKNVATEQLFDFQVKLLLLSHTIPTDSKPLKRLKNWITEITNSKASTVALTHYLQIVVLYNKLLMPYTPPHIKYFIARYYKEKHTKKCNEKLEKVKKNTTSAVRSGAYEKFLAKLRDDNIKQSKQATNKKSIPATNTSSCISNSNSHSAIAETSCKVTPQNSKKRRTCIVTLSHHDEIVCSAPKQQIVELHSKTTSTDVMSITPLGNGSTNSNVDSVSNVQSKKYVEQSKTKNSDKTADVGCTTKKKKKKSKKEKKTEQCVTNKPALQLSKNLKHDRDKCLIKKAKKVINEALTFKLPYMNKAVVEVQKRLDDNSIAQKHLNVLQKLVNLEKSHQEHVISFYNSLK